MKKFIIKRIILALLLIGCLTFATVNVIKAFSNDSNEGFIKEGYTYESSSDNEIQDEYSDNESSTDVITETNTYTP